MTVTALSLGLLSCIAYPKTETELMKSERIKNERLTTVHSPISNQSPYTGKPVVYQVFTRLFGNTNTTNKPWGTLAENGVGKFNDFTPQALESIKALGTTHIWYTGVPHHALATSYLNFGISDDDPDVIKGRAGSPYAVKDYYNVNPDLAVNPANRLHEFEALIQRTHQHGMKVVIDIVPNHVARRYQSLSPRHDNFGANDDTSQAYSRENNFYYIPNTPFELPEGVADTVLGGKATEKNQHPLADRRFDEFPAKWTGNGSRAPQPDINDWYETVKINYGVRPDGTYDFPVLPEAYRDKSAAVHAAFWADKSLPDSWYKFRDIAIYWLDKGVDGFRFDMAEMVPVEFWSFLNSAIKQQNADAFLLAEVYQPDKYRDYIQLGKMDYLYDKVGFYDTLKSIIRGEGKVSALVSANKEVADISSHMLNFLENHDEQRIPSADFAGSAEQGKPALTVSALINKAPFLLYFGQDVGEDGSEDTGFGDPTRTTIFDYAGVPAHQRWMNQGQFDGGQSTAEEKSLRRFYEQVMKIASSNAAILGDFISLHAANLAQTALKSITHNKIQSSRPHGYTEQQFAFIRHAENDAILVIANFSAHATGEFTLTVPTADMMEINALGGSFNSAVLNSLSINNANNTTLSNNPIAVKALLSHEDSTMTATENGLEITISLEGLESKVFDLVPD
ncbi:alpha-amylase family protein [Alteromonas sp. 1_MG-2023]|uniref:alpha-amylase family protein n=1 Tax=Alteromonas sp. 1_MG-2023 TaxID=3062669 RepID=UPI0026E341DE|nr:alpha-amylase family protein [Alteromonas sp. 1_MG-2023]MDO6565967.1 alpha-amylase family protein [Alteromonas sp. 1_MG-2023]